MRLRKIAKILSAVVLLASLNNAFADSCPSPEKIRESTNLSFAYNPSNYQWVLVSSPFAYENKKWQTIFVLDLVNTTEPEHAVNLGRENFNRSPLSYKPTSKITNDKIECSYAPANAKYQVIVQTPAAYGRKG